MCFGAVYAWLLLELCIHLTHSTTGKVMTKPSVTCVGLLYPSAPVWEPSRDTSGGIGAE